LLDSVPDGRSIAAAPEAGRMALGLLLPLTGKFAQPAELVRRGVESAQRAAQGRGWPVPELVLGDTKGEPEGARLAFRKLAEEAQVSAVIGPMVNAEAEAIAPLADELGVPTLMLVQRPGLALGRSAVWNHWVTAEEQVTGLLDYVIAQLGLTRFAVAYPERQGAAEVVERFWSRVEERGGTVTSVEAFNPDATDYRETARRITGRAYTGGGGDPVLPFLAARQRPQVAPGAAILKPGEDFQAIFVADSYKRVTMLVPGFLYEEINLGGHLPTKDRPPVVLLGGAAFNHRDLVGRGGKYVNGAVLVDGFFARSPDPEVVAFVKDCMDAWKTEPSILEAVGWDLASIVSQALAEGAQGRKGLRAAIPALRPKVKVAGALGFRPDGEMEHQLFVIRVQDGAFTQVWPEPVAMETTPAP
jgi:ABC-type branched-subunit amino acid transport system substrate-binding protein